MKSRYRTLEHLRQIPADEVLTRHEPEVALKILLDRCGRSAGRREALAGMTFDYDDEKITFGQLLDSLPGPLAHTGTDTLTGRPVGRCVRGASARAVRACRFSASVSCNGAVAWAPSGRLALWHLPAVSASCRLLKRERNDRPLLSPGPRRLSCGEGGGTVG
ncbi:hypothetical protein GCM10017688_41300 [Streptomyces ramulosus]